MTKLLDHATETVRGLPAAVQDDFASVLLRLAGEADGTVVRLTPADRAALEAADAEIARGEFATDPEMHELWKKPILSR